MPPPLDSLDLCVPSESLLSPPPFMSWTIFPQMFKFNHKTSVLNSMDIGHGQLIQKGCDLGAPFTVPEVFLRGGEDLSTHRTQE